MQVVTSEEFKRVWNERVILSASGQPEMKEGSVYVS